MAYAGIILSRYLETLAFVLKSMLAYTKGMIYFGRLFYGQWFGLYKLGSLPQTEKMIHTSAFIYGKYLIYFIWKTLLKQVENSSKPALSSMKSNFYDWLFQDRRNIWGFNL